MNVKHTNSNICFTWVRERKKSVLKSGTWLNAPVVELDKTGWTHVWSGYESFEIISKKICYTELKYLPGSKAQISNTAFPPLLKFGKRESFKKILNFLFK